MLVFGARLVLFLVYACLGRNVVANSNLALTPAQILLPQTNYYTKDSFKESVKVSVQVLLRVEPRICAKWEVQNEHLLQLLTSASLDDSVSGPGGFTGSRDGCFPSIWVTSVPSINATRVDVERTWVYAHDPATLARAGAEVIISKIHKIQFETRNRKIAVNQVATLRITSQDRYNNTFTTLEGLPFAAKIQDSNIMQIIDLRNDPEVATKARLDLLDKRGQYQYSLAGYSGFTVTSDVIVLQGKTVGKTKISVRLLLPEYKDIVLNDVEFTVSENLMLEPARLILPPNADFKFCLLPAGGHSATDVSAQQKPFKVDLKNFTWSCDGTGEQSFKADGTFSSGSLTAATTSVQVVLKDKRNGEVFTSEISVKTPKSLGFSYGNVVDVITCFYSKGLEPPREVALDLQREGRDASIQKLLNNFYQSVYASCMGGAKCGKQLLAKDKQITSVCMGNLYLWDVVLLDADALPIYVVQNTKIKWTPESDKLLKIHWQSANGRFVLLEILKIDDLDDTRVDRQPPHANITVEALDYLDANTGKPLTVTLTLSVAKPVTIKGFEQGADVIKEDLAGLTKLASDATSAVVAASSASLLGHVKGVKPMVLPVQESLQVHVVGGTGEYSYKLYDESIATIDAKGVLTTLKHGTSVLRVQDKNNAENWQQVQLIVDDVHVLAFKDAHTRVDVEAGHLVTLSLQAFTAPQVDNAGRMIHEGYLFYAYPSLASPTVSTDALVLPRIEFTAGSNGNAQKAQALHLIKTSVVPFTCTTFYIEALDQGTFKVEVLSRSLDGSQKSAAATLHVFRPLSLVLHPCFSHYPLASTPSSFKSTTNRQKDVSQPFANVTLGGYVKVIATGGPPGGKVELKPCIATGDANSGAVLVEQVLNEIWAEFNVYCIAETKEQDLCLEVNGRLYSKSRMRCQIPSHLELVPLVPANSQASPLENLKHAQEALQVYKPGQEVPRGMFKSAVGLVTFEDKNKSKSLIKMNAAAHHVFMAVAYDADGLPLLPNTNFKVAWYGAAAQSKSKDGEAVAPPLVNGSIFIFKGSLGPPVDLIANLEWLEAFEPDASAKFLAALKPKTVTNALNKWPRSEYKRNIPALGDVAILTLLPPHEIFIGAAGSSAPSGSSFGPSPIQVSLFFDPRKKYQFAVAFGSGNYLELPSLPECGTLQHGASLQDASAAAAGASSDTVQLYDVAKITAMATVLVGEKARYASKSFIFSSATPCTRFVQVVDKSLMGQVTASISIHYAPVVKIRVIIDEIKPDAFEDYNALCEWKPSLNVVKINQLYRIHVVALDSNGIPMSYPSLKNVTFTVNGPHGLYQQTLPRAHNFSATGHAQVVQFLAEGTFVVVAELQNFGGASAKGEGASVVSDSAQVVVYKESKPIFTKLVLLPNSPEFQLPMLENSLSRSNLQSVSLQSDKEQILTVLGTDTVGCFQTHKTGNCSLICSTSCTGQIAGTNTHTLDVTVAHPHSITLASSSGNDVMVGSSVPLVATLLDKQGVAFTSLYLAGVVESQDKSYCHFSWTIQGNGSLIDGTGAYKSVSGVGLVRAVIHADDAGILSLQVKVVCKHLANDATVQLGSNVLALTAIQPKQIFYKQPRYTPLILATRGNYQTQEPIAQVSSCTEKEHVVQLTSQGNALVTRSATGDALLKLSSSETLHVQIRNIEILQLIESTDTDGDANTKQDAGGKGSASGLSQRNDTDTDTGIFSSAAGTRYKLLLKTRLGQIVTVPSNTRLKVFSSNAGMLKLRVDGTSVYTSANMTRGCCSLLVQLDMPGRNEGFDPSEPWDIHRICLSNVLVPQDAEVVEGSSIRYLGGHTRSFTFGLDGIRLLSYLYQTQAQSQAHPEHCSTSAACYQQAIGNHLPHLLVNLSRQLSSAIASLLAHEDDGTSSGSSDFYYSVASPIHVYPPLVQVSSGNGILKPVYIFTFKIPNLGSFAHASETELARLGILSDPVELATRLSRHLVSTSKDSEIFAMLETPISPLYDGGGVFTSSLDSHLTVNANGIGNAIFASQVTIGFSKGGRQGTSRTSIFDSLSSVQVLHVCTNDAIAPDAPFSHVPGKCPKAAHGGHATDLLVFRARAGQFDIKATTLVDPKVLAICNLTTSGFNATAAAASASAGTSSTTNQQQQQQLHLEWLSKAYSFYPVQVPQTNADFLPACKMNTGGFASQVEWTRFTHALKVAPPSLPTMLKLNAALYSSLGSETGLTASQQGGISGLGQKSLLLSQRHVNKLLWNSTFDFDLPLIAVFSTCGGVKLDSLDCNGSDGSFLVVYPFYNGCSLTTDNKNIQVKVLEHQGLWCKITISNESNATGLVTLNKGKVTLATLALVPNGQSASSGLGVGRLGYIDERFKQQQRHQQGGGGGGSRLLGDLASAMVTSLVAAATMFLLYILWQRQQKFYDAAEPVKIERKMPNVFQNIYETDYLGNISAASNAAPLWAHARPRF